MFVSIPSRRLLSFLSVGVYGLVFTLFCEYERPGLGIGHFYYLGVALAALAGGPASGAIAGVLAAGLYALGFDINPHLHSSSVLTEATLIRASTFVMVGTLIGWFATRHRQLVAELRILADRDTLTGLPNTRAFEIAITRSLERRTPFALLVGNLGDLNGGDVSVDDQLRRVAGQLLLSLEPTDEIARIGATEFAILASGKSGNVGKLAVRLETLLAQSGFSITFGWGSYPQDGENALSLYRAANERFYARKIVRDSGPAERADDADVVQLPGR